MPNAYTESCVRLRCLLERKPAIPPLKPAHTGKVGLEPKHTAVRSPESNGMAEAFEHYNEWHPHSALGYRSPREYLRRRTSNGLSDKKCLEI